MTDVELYALCVSSDRSWYAHCHRYDMPNLKRRSLVSQTKTLIQLDKERNHMESGIIAERRKRWRDEAIREGRLLPNCRCLLHPVSLWFGPLVKNPYAAVNPNGAVLYDDKHVRSGVRGAIPFTARPIDRSGFIRTPERFAGGSEARDGVGCA